MHLSRRTRSNSGVGAFDSFRARGGWRARRRNTSHPPAVCTALNLDVKSAVVVTVPRFPQM
jgi:hypothetical protein